MTTLTYTGRLVITSCWCGISLAIPEDLYNIANRKDNFTVYCPLGHKFIYGSTTEGELREAREELARARRRNDATRELLHHEERSHAATKGHLTRTKRRVAAGVCPCCTRNFKDLSRHMKSKHPDYVKAAERRPGEVPVRTEDGE